jgi:signal transduction histidine kinase/ligand-binding sensor domain-containing protein
MGYHVVYRLLTALALFALSLTQFWFVSSARADEASGQVLDLDSEYVIDSWQTENGLADDFINKIVQSPDGYLWILTFNGLCRFNGTEFVTFDAGNTPELASTRMADAWLDRKRRLWLRSESGAWTQWWKGQFKRFGPENGLPATGLGSWREDAGGDVWLASYLDSSTSYQLSGDKFKVADGSATLLSRLGITSDIHSRGWTIQSNHLCCVDASMPVDVLVPGFQQGGWRLEASADGGIWVIANRIQKYRDGKWIDFGPVPVPTDNFNHHMEDRKGNLWVGTDLGEIWRTSSNQVIQRFKIHGNPSSQIGRGLIEDSEGDIWLGTGGGGLFRLKPRAFHVYGVNDGLTSALIRSVTQDRDGNMWFAAVNRLDWSRPVETFRAEARELPVVLPWEVLGTRDGSLWVGTFGEGLFRQNGSKGEWIKPKGGNPPINAMFEEANGEVDLGTPRGLFRVREGVMVKVEGPAALVEMDVRAIAEDSQHQLYLGLERQGLLKSSGTGWEHFTMKDGLPDDHIRALCVDSNDTVWVGTQGRGLSRFKSGHFFNFNEKPDPSPNFDLPERITSILEDNLGNLWLASTRGLFRAARAQLDEVAQGKQGQVSVVHYDRSEGMGSSQCINDHQPGAWKARDGTLWFATMKGIVVTDPKTLSFNSNPPPVVIEGVYLNDSPHSSAKTESSMITVPAGNRRLEIRYAALSFMAPAKVHYRYRLSSFDQDWVNAGNHRSAYYTRLPPGQYRFEVIAANSDNVWNNQAAYINVRILPTFWQTLWFRAVSVMALLAAAGWIYHLRVRRLQLQRALHESFSRKLIESQESERKRMAAELHDSLGQNLLVLNNQAMMALKDLTNAQKTEERLHKISAGASACIEEVRSVARSLRPYQLDRFGLSKTLEDIGELLSDTAGLRVTTRIDNVDGLLTPDAEISVYRITQEWLNNVVKHSRATEARLEIQRYEQWVQLVLEDNGVGFDYAAAMTREGRQQSFGLLNLRERARLLGGTAEVETATGKGTRWTVNIPYAKTQNSPDR